MSHRCARSRYPAEDREKASDSDIGLAAHATRRPSLLARLIAEHSLMFSLNTGTRQATTAAKMTQQARTTIISALPSPPSRSRPSSLSIQSMRNSPNTEG